MQRLAVIAAITVHAGLSYAQAPTPYELHKCEGRDTFTYWTTPPCAAGDRSIAMAREDPTKPLAEQIRRAECRIQTAMKSPKPPAGGIGKAANRDHCDYR